MLISWELVGGLLFRSGWPPVANSFFRIRRVAGWKEQEGSDLVGKAEGRNTSTTQSSWVSSAAITQAV